MRFKTIQVPKDKPLCKSIPVPMGKMIKTKAGNTVMRMKKCILVKSGDSLRKYAPAYDLDLGDMGHIVMEYGKVPLYGSPTPTGENWEMWYGCNDEYGIPTDYPGLHFFAEAYMFVKPYGPANDNRKQTTNYLTGSERAEWLMDNFRALFPEYMGVSDEFVVGDGTDENPGLEEYHQYVSMVAENESDIKSVRVTGRINFFVFDMHNGALTLIHSFDLDSSSDFYNDPDEFIDTHYEPGAYRALTDALLKLDDYIATTDYAPAVLTLYTDGIEINMPRRSKKGEGFYWKAEPTSIINPQGDELTITVDIGQAGEMFTGMLVYHMGDTKSTRNYEGESPYDILAEMQDEIINGYDMFAEGGRYQASARKSKPTIRPTVRHKVNKSKPQRKQPQSAW